MNKPDLNSGIINVYVLSRKHKDEVLVHIMNKNEGDYELDLKHFEELELNGKTLKNIFTDQSIDWSDRITLNEKGSYLFTTK